MSTCSKAPRGLFVHVEVGRVFTAIAISPSKPSRQLLARYAIDAGQNSPGKELRLNIFVLNKFRIINTVLMCEYQCFCISPCSWDYIFLNRNFSYSKKSNV